MDHTLIVLVVLAALAHAWMNGMHDAANSVATALSTGALTMRVALPMSAVLNVVGALVGVTIARSLGLALVTVPVHAPDLVVVLVALLSAIGWNALTWWWGLPSSTSHAMIGALAGAGLAAGITVDWQLLGDWLVLPLLISPILGFGGAWLLMLVLLRLFRDAAHEKAVRGFRMAQAVSAATVAVGHGLQDGQKTMGVLTLALGASGAVTLGPRAADPSRGAEDLRVLSAAPVWVQVTVALALGLGTLAGGRRIIRTLGRRLVRMTPTTGFAAESVASLMLYTSAALVGVPVSTTHSVTAAVIGAGSTAGLRSIRWRTVRRVLAAWLLTPLVTFGVAWSLTRLCT